MDETHGRWSGLLKRSRWLCLSALLAWCVLLASCARAPEPVPVVELPIAEEQPAVEELVEAAPVLTAVSWQEVPGWLDDDPSLALGAFQKSCRALRHRPQWRSACSAALNLERGTEEEVRSFFESYFVPHTVRQEDGSSEGLLTGYYVPDLRGSRTQSKAYPYPLYHRPDDLLTIDLSSVYPDLGNYRLRGRLDGNRVVPYWQRGEIDGPQQPLAGQELFWLGDPVELFFLHIQGSGRIILDDGSRAMVSYADQNGYPYRSIGRYLLELGAMTRDQMSMQNIRAWARRNPERVGELLGQNPSYIFFRELAGGNDTPPGALGVPLTPGRSLAVDRRYIPLGAPVFVDTTWPNSERALRRLMMAQDVGGAIKGRVRGDFFWGMGKKAGARAGRMKQPARFWVLLPLEEK